MRYEVLPTKVSVCFYDRSKDWRAKIIKYSALTDIHHCGIMLDREGSRVVLASDKSHKAKFVDADKFHNLVYAPIKVVELDEAHVSLQQLTDFLYSHDKLKWKPLTDDEAANYKPKKYPSYRYIGDARSIIFWYFLGRFILPKLLPPSCALMTCYLLRICGFKVGDHVQPKTLYKELDDAANYNSWTSWGWKDYASTYNCC